MRNYGPKKRQKWYKSIVRCFRNNKDNFKGKKECIDQDKKFFLFSEEWMSSANYIQRKGPCLLLSPSLVLVVHEVPSLTRFRILPSANKILPLLTFMLYICGFIARQVKYSHEIALFAVILIGQKKSLIENSQIKILYDKLLINF